MHGPGDLADAFEVAEDLTVSFDVALEDPPVVDPRLPWRPGVGEQEAPIQLAGIHRNRLVMDAVRLQIDNLYTAYVDVLAARLTLKFSEVYARRLKDLYALTHQLYERGQKTEGEVLTGLLFLDESAPDMHELNQTPEIPLTSIPYETLCPGSARLAKLQEEYR